MSDIYKEIEGEVGYYPNHDERTNLSTRERFNTWNFGSDYYNRSLVFNIDKAVSGTYNLTFKFPSDEDYDFWNNYFNELYDRHDYNIIVENEYNQQETLADFHLNEDNRKRYKKNGSTLVRINDEKGKIINWLLDIGLHHERHTHTSNLTRDRLFLNKIDNNDNFDYWIPILLSEQNNLKFKFPDNLTVEDWSNRVTRLTKFVDRDDFHMWMDERWSCGLGRLHSFMRTWNYVHQRGNITYQSSCNLDRYNHKNRGL